MRDYWLAKLIGSVTEVDSRKRLQKSIYLLQRAGCPLRLSYILHYYGPYSFDLAGLIDQLDGAGIIEENQVGSAYKSRIMPFGKEVIKDFEKTKVGVKARKELDSFIPKFKVLNKKDPWLLELAATAAYFHKDNWEEAKRQTARFKHLQENDSNLQKAIKIAGEFLARP